MNFDKPIEVNLLDFFREGKFDFLKIGRSKDWVYHNFPSPDGTSKLSELKEYDIWCYGNIELHFNNDLLWMIYSDYMDNLDGGPSITLDKWFLEEPSELDLLRVMEYLNTEGIDFAKIKRTFDQNSVDLKLLNSGIKLLFVASDDEAIDSNQNSYTLYAFSKNE